MLKIMKREEQALVLIITAIGGIAILLAAFIWPGTGKPSLTSNGGCLFDSRQVERIYFKLSQGAIEIYSERKSGDSYTEVSFGSGFLIDNVGYITRDHHLVQEAE